MPRKVEINEKTYFEIGEFTTDRGTEFVSVRKMYRGTDGNFYPAKYKSGGYVLLNITVEEWEPLLFALNDYFDLSKNSTLIKKEEEDLPF